MPDDRRVNLRDVFLRLQSQMVAKLECNREVVAHPGTKGDATEACWRDMLATYLPQRYRVEKAFVIDADGALSEQIDIVIFDRHFSPFLFSQDGAVYVPAESVYAIIEVKQTVSKAYVEYAGQKAASVRRRRRTSAIIHHAGGTFPAKKPFEIAAGLVALSSEWKPPLGDPFGAAIAGLATEARLDLGCCLEGGAFDIAYGTSGPEIHVSQPGDGLIVFFLRLLSRLQQLGSVPAMDITEYERNLSL